MYTQYPQFSPYVTTRAHLLRRFEVWPMNSTRSSGLSRRQSKSKVSSATVSGSSSSNSASSTFLPTSTCKVAGTLLRSWELCTTNRSVTLRPRKVLARVLDRKVVQFAVSTVRQVLTRIQHLFSCAIGICRVLCCPGKHSEKLYNCSGGHERVLGPRV